MGISPTVLITCLCLSIRNNNISNVEYGQFILSCRIQIRNINLSTGKATNITNSTLVKLITNESRISC